jgi:hypothetical protein
MRKDYMDEPLTWQIEHDAMTARLRHLGSILGNQSLPATDREQAARDFVPTWQAFCRHVNEMNPRAVLSQSDR